jgi:chitinase
MQNKDDLNKIKATKEKEKKIKAELNRLKKLFNDLDVDVQKACNSLIDNAAFMAVTLKELQEAINADGIVSTYQNGANQWGTKKSPEVETYNSMLKNYMIIIKNLIDLLPKDKKDELDEFDKFISLRQGG